VLENPSVGRPHPRAAQVHEELAARDRHAVVQLLELHLFVPQRVAARLARQAHLRAPLQPERRAVEIDEHGRAVRRRVRLGDQQQHALPSRRRKRGAP
jgi:hypothetical protein